MLGNKSFEHTPRQAGIPKATPEEILAAMRAADIAARENSEKLKKMEAEHADSKRIEKLWLEKEGEEKGPYVINEEKIKQAEKTVGKNFEGLN